MACRKVGNFEKTCTGGRRGTEKQWCGKGRIGLARDENEHHRQHAVRAIWMDQSATGGCCGAIHFLRVRILHRKVDREDEFGGVEDS